MRSQPLLARIAAAALPRETWRRNQLAVNLAAGLVFFGFTLVMPFLPLYVAELGVTGVGRIAFWSGLLLSIPPLLAATLGPFWAGIADRYGMKLMVGRVLTTMTLIWGLMYFASNVYHVLVLRIVLGVFSGFSAMSAALVTQSCPRDRIGRAIGTLQATQILSTALGPLAGGILYALIGIRNAFLVTSCFCVTALGLIAVLYRDLERPARQGIDRGSSRTPDLRAKWAEMRGLPGFLPLLPFLFFTNLVDRSFASVIPLYVQSMIGDFPKAVATFSGGIVTSNALAAALSALLLGRLVTSFRPARILIAILAGGVASTALMAFCRTPGQFLMLRLAAGLFTGGAITLGYTFGGASIPAARRASLYGILSSATMLGGAAGPLASGVLVGIGLKAPLLAATLTYLALVPWVATTLSSLPPIERPPEPPPEVRTRPVNQA